MPTAVYSDDIKIKDALQIYFAKYHFADGGYNDTYFKIKLGPLYIPFPNTEKRIKAVKFHDIHHLLTEYTALWKGEVEIGAWEIASGCGRFFIAWFLNFGSFGVGLFLFPRALFRAFMMGRNVRTNLYYNYIYSDELLNRTVGELRKELGTGVARKNNAADYLYFSGCVLLILAVPAAVLFISCVIFKL